MAYERIEIPAHTDRWMKGDRYGDLMQVTRHRDGTEIAHVLLDKSGDLRKFFLIDCRILD